MPHYNGRIANPFPGQGAYDKPHDHSVAVAQMPAND
jgi:hypothetical protein